MQYTEVKYDGSPLSVNVFGPSPERDELGMEFDAGMGFGIFNAGFEFDYGSFEWTYDETLAGYFGSFDVHKESRSRVSATLGADVTEKINVGLAVERLSYSYDTDYIGDAEPGVPEFENPSSFEFIASANVGLWPDWTLLMDIRRMSYENAIAFTGETAQDIEFNDDSFVAPYVALAYSPRENVEVRVGYGVSPTNYVDTPVEGRGNGRERWLSEYLWDHSDHDILDAEDALADARVIGVMAVITF